MAKSISSCSGSQSGDLPVKRDCTFEKAVIDTIKVFLDGHRLLLDNLLALAESNDDVAISTAIACEQALTLDESLMALSQEISASVQEAEMLYLSELGFKPVYSGRNNTPHNRQA